MNKGYLDELMDVTIHHFVRRNPGKLFKVVMSDDVVCLPQGCGSILPNVGPNFIVSFITECSLGV